MVESRKISIFLNVIEVSMRLLYALVLLLIGVGLQAQAIDPNSTPPGAPIRAQSLEEAAQRTAPRHPGNAGERVAVSNFTIIESQSFNSGHAMDVVWRNLLLGMGHTPTIAPQTTLDNNSFFGGTDVLIIASGVISLTPARMTIVQQFMQSGKPVYIQGEYLPTYQTNVLFQNIVNATGGSFAVGSTVAGDLTPCNILNAYATTPNSVPSIGYHWYGCTGSGCNNIEYFMRYGASNLGFVYCPSNGAWGDIIQSTDQDWVNQSTSLNLMRNIVYHLLSGNACSVVCGTVLGANVMDLTAQSRPDGTVALDWSLDGELPAGRFEISVNGLLLGELAIAEGAGMDFQWIDPRLPAGEQVYAVRFYDRDGQASLQAEVTIDLGAPAPALRVVPAADGVRVWASADITVADLWLVDLAGRRQRLPVERSIGSAGQAISMQQFPHGQYWLLGATQDGRSLQARFGWLD